MKRRDVLASCRLHMSQAAGLAAAAALAAAFTGHNKLGGVLILAAIAGLFATSGLNSLYRKADR